jgi:alpha-L-arabinofuranosidase
MYCLPATIKSRYATISQLRMTLTIGKLFSNTRTTPVLPTTSDSKFGPAYWVAGVNANTKQYILKAAIYNATAPVPLSVAFGNGKGTKATLTVLTAPSPYSENVLGGSNQVQQTVSTIYASVGAFSFTLPNYSVALLTSAVV